MTFLKLCLISAFFIALIFSTSTISAKRIPQHYADMVGVALRDNRIVGGQEAPEAAAPYQVSIQTITNTHICGGVILNAKHILTAGHCMLDFRIDYLRIIVGTNNRSAPGQILEPISSTVHCMYDLPAIYNNDIAVVRLNDSIKFNARTKSIELSLEHPPAGALVTLTGWGSPQLNESPVERLQSIDLRIVDRDACLQAWDNSNGVDIGHICTFTKAGEGACNGDSGGPIVWQGKLVGLVNWGAPCAVGKPDMHANTVYYLDWINRALQQCNILKH